VEEFITADVVIGEPRVASLVKAGWAEKIRGEVRARSLSIRLPGEAAPAPGAAGLESSWDIEGIEVRTTVSRAP
jgi:hypothetical protein